MAVLPVKRGLSSPAVIAIPENWDRQWFRYFIDSFLTNADIRNVTPGSGITISGNVSGNSTTGSASSTVTIAQSPIATNTVMGNVSGITAIPVALSKVQLTTLINLFTATLSGAVPLSGGGTVNFLRADGTWATPAGSAAIPNNTVLGNVSGVSAAAVALTQVQLTALINVFTSTLTGSVPASGGGTVKFLRADGTFVAPAYPTSANPSAQSGPTAVNGSAATFMTSDSAPAINVAAAYTWGGIHTFNARVAAAAGLTVSGGTFLSRGITDNATANAVTVASTGTVTINTPTSGIALTVGGTNASIAASIISGLSASTAGADTRVSRAGSTINQAGQGPNIFLNDTTNVTGYYLQDSGGQFELWSSVGAGPVLTQILKVPTTGGLSINAPTSGNIALIVTGVSGTQAVSATGGISSNGTSTNPNSGTTQVFLNGGNSATMGYVNASAGADLKIWDSFVDASGIFHARAVNDAYNAATDWVTVTRTTFVPSGIQFSTKVGVNNVTPPAQVTGWGTPTGASVVANFPGGGPATLAQCSNAIAKIITDLKAFGLYGA